MPPPAPASNLVKPGGAVEIAKKAELEDDLLKGIQPDFSVQQFVEHLLKDDEVDHGPAAMKLLSFALERREAVWWAIQCVKGQPALLEKPAAQETLAAAEAWFSGFSDESRRAAFAKSESLGLAEPAAIPGAAAFFCEGSIAPPTVAEQVFPDPKVVFVMSAAAVTLAAVAKEPEKAKERYPAFTQLAQDIADGKNRWKESPASPAARSVGLPLAETAAPPSPSATPEQSQAPATSKVIPADKPVPPRPPKKGYY